MIDVLGIKEIRAKTGLSRAQFCRLLCIPYRTVEDWESGKRKAPDYLVRLIKYYCDKEFLQLNDEQALQQIKISCINKEE